MKRQLPPRTNARSNLHQASNHGAHVSMCNLHTPFPTLRPRCTFLHVGRMRCVKVGVSWTGGVRGWSSCDRTAAPLLRTRSHFNLPLLFLISEVSGRACYTFALSPAPFFSFILLRSLFPNAATDRVCKRSLLVSSPLFSSFLSSSFVLVRTRAAYLPSLPFPCLILLPGSSFLSSLSLLSFLMLPQIASSTKRSWLFFFMPLPPSSRFLLSLLSPAARPSLRDAPLPLLRLTVCTDCRCFSATSVTPPPHLPSPTCHTSLPLFYHHVPCALLTRKLSSLQFIVNFYLVAFFLQMKKKSEMESRLSEWFTRAF
jgi:hypothetical protein